MIAINKSLILQETSKLSAKVAALFCVYEQSGFSISSLAFGVVTFFFNHSNRCIVIFHCNLHILLCNSVNLINVFLKYFLFTFFLVNI